MPEARFALAPASQAVGQGRESLMDALPDFAQLQLHFVDHVQRRYEVIRPLVLLGDRTAAQRAEETQMHSETVRDLTRRFRQHGMLGLFPEHTGLLSPSRGKQVPEAVVAELTRLKALYHGFGYRELARILLCKLEYRIDAKTVKRLWQHSAVPVQGELPFGDYHHQATRTQARLQVIKLSYQGWNTLSISRVLHVSRPTIDRWIQRFEADHVAGLGDKSSSPQTTTRKAWLPLMMAMYHLQKRHPDAGRFRMWSLLANTTISERTVGRVMALNKQVYDDIPHVARLQPTKPPGPHPYKASQPHQYWFIDGRMMDFAFDGVFSLKETMARSGDDADEISLVELAARGDADAFAALFNRYYSMIYAFAYRLCLRQSDAEDIAQQTFIKAARSLCGFRQKSSFKHWLFHTGGSLEAIDMTVH